MYIYIVDMVYIHYGYGIYIYSIYIVCIKL